MYLNSLESCVLVLFVGTLLLIIIKNDNDKRLK